MKIPLCFIYVSCLIRTEAAKSKKSTKAASEEKDDWNSIACSAYEECLQRYDEMIGKCGFNAKKVYDDEDLCYIPIAKQYLALVAEKRRRNRILRKCFVTGQVIDIEKGEVADHAVAKRKKSTCRHKIAEIVQFKEKLDTQIGKKTKSQETCKAACKRFKDKCQKLESCCSRVKDCRRMVGTHPVVEKMKTIENALKEDRRDCKEHLKSEHFFIYGGGAERLHFISSRGIIYKCGRLLD